MEGVKKERKAKGNKINEHTPIGLRERGGGEEKWRAGV